MCGEAAGGSGIGTMGGHREGRQRWEMDVLGRGTERALQGRQEGAEGASGESRGKEGGAERGNEKAWVSRQDE